MYTVSGGKSVPAWLSDKKKRSLKKDEAYRRRIELVQVTLFECCLEHDGLRSTFIIADGAWLFLETVVIPTHVVLLHLDMVSCGSPDVTFAHLSLHWTTPVQTSTAGSGLSGGLPAAACEPRRAVSVRYGHPSAAGEDLQTSSLVELLGVLYPSYFLRFVVELPMHDVLCYVAVVPCSTLTLLTQVLCSILRSGCTTSASCR